MKKKCLILAILIIIAIFLVLTYTKTVIFSRVYSHVHNKENIQIVLGELNAIWSRAEIDSESYCKQEENIDELYYQCNPKYFSCLIENNIIQKIIAKYNIDFDISKDYKYQQKSGLREYVFNSKINSVEVNISLLDTCHEVYLPNRFYPFLVNDRKHTYEWDNHGKKIFIDKYLTRVYEIRDYATVTNNSKLFESQEKFKDEDIAINLDVDEMDQYCNYQSKQVLTAQVYDAATIYPEDISDTKSRLFRAPYYPWSRKNSDTEIFKIQKNQKINLSKEEKGELCDKIYSMDCLDESYKHYDRNNVTWSGVYETMGGYFEYLPNTLYPKENIKLSSRYFYWSSLFHRVGMRGFWDEQGFLLGNFNFDGIEQIQNTDNFKVAFRCMRHK